MPADRCIRVPRESSEGATLHHLIVVSLTQLLRRDPCSEHGRENRTGRGAAENIRRACGESELLLEREQCTNRLGATEDSPATKDDATPGAGQGIIGREGCPLHYCADLAVRPRLITATFTACFNSSSASSSPPTRSARSGTESKSAFTATKTRPSYDVMPMLIA